MFYSSNVLYVLVLFRGVGYNMDPGVLLTYTLPGLANDSFDFALCSRSQWGYVQRILRMGHPVLRMGTYIK